MQVGHKAESLQRLREAGFNVPRFIICDETWTEAQILEAIGKELSNVEVFAVRSSSELEDSATKSFAGQFYTALGVKRQRVFLECRKVVESIGAGRGSVIVQEFIASDAAGVMFTRVGGDRVLINSTIGLCRTVVDGRSCDEYVCDWDGTILKKTISKEKDVCYFRDGEIVNSKEGGESLSVEQVRELVRMADRVETFFGAPQDVEWCFLGTMLHLLQSRPITSTVELPEVTYYDSANIAESYTGIVLPLTCSFAQSVYEQVYTDLLSHSGVSTKELAKHSVVFKNLLGFFYGRMYYNMNNWYRTTAFVPGYQRNKQNFELMITSNIREPIAMTIQPPTSLKFLYPFIVIVKTAMFGITAKRFTLDVEQAIRELRARDLGKMDYEACVAMHRELERRLLRRWYVTVENDFFVMTYLGILKKLIPENELQSALVFRSKATEQVVALASLSRTFQDSPQELLRSFEWQEYLHTFGGRFASELKLESVGIDEDPDKLFAQINAYRDYKTPELSTYEPSGSFLKRTFVGILLRKFRKYASRREVNRLLRSNVFAIARKLFRSMGELLVEKGALENVDDVFYLRLEELLSQTASRVQIDERKNEYRGYQDVKPPAHFASSGEMPALVEGSVLTGSTIQGKPASQGKVKGRVRVFREFSMPSTIDFDILVASHTDPGWTSLIALSKGLIIEHGGVLSHASIVARELRVPAVIGASDAMRILKDGQMVEMDGSTGMIRMIEPKISLIMDARLPEGEAFFGFMEFPNDERVFEELWSDLLDEARRKGIRVLKGPVNGSIWHDYRCVKESDGSPWFTSEPRSELHQYTFLKSKSPSNEITYYSGYRERFDAILTDGRPAFESLGVKGFSIEVPERLSSEIMGDVFRLSKEVFRGSWGYTELTEAEFADLYRPGSNERQNRLYLLKKEGKTIGFGLVIVESRETWIYKTICLDPAFHGSGLGSALAYRVHLDAEQAGVKKMIYALIREGNAIGNFPKDDAVIFRRYAAFEFNV